MSNPINGHPERNNEIIRLRESGKTLKALGEMFGISGPRVRQIVMRHKRMMRRATL